MTIKLFTTALFAGLIAGLVAILLQFFFMEDLILEAEEYESGMKTHFAGVHPEAQAEAHDAASGHDQTLADDGHAHSHDDAATGESESNFSRFLLAFATDFIVFVAWGLLMVAGFAIAENFGKPITPTAALLWGIAGFAALHVLPGIGLAPELPGIVAADLQSRQIWWIGTVIASVIGLAVIGYGGSPVTLAIGIAILAIPHIIGAPRPDEMTGVAPPELAGEYVSRSYAVAFFAWVTLGAAAGYFWTRPQSA